MQNLALVDETFDLNFTSEYHLSIQFSLDGLSFCTLDSIQKKYVQITHHPIGSGDSPLLVKHLRNFYNEEEKLSGDYKSTQIIFSSPKATLIPSSYFEKAKAQKFIDLNFGGSSEKILNNPLSPFSGELAFEIPVRLFDFITEKHPDISIKHECIPFIWNAYNAVHADNFLTVLIRKDYIWLVYATKNQLKFINSFSYQSDDDMLYFIMNVVSTMNIDPEKTPILLEGIASKKAAIYHRVRQYIKHVQLSSAHPDYHYSYLFDQIPDGRFVTMLNLQACAL